MKFHNLGEESGQNFGIFTTFSIFSSYIFWIKQICNKITWWKRCTFLNNTTWIVCQNLDKFVKFFKICQGVFKRNFLFFCRKYFLGCQRKKIECFTIFLYILNKHFPSIFWMFTCCISIKILEREDGVLNLKTNFS